MQESPDILTQGAEYEFLISNKIRFPGESSEVFILIGPGEKRYILNASYYDHYNLEKGSRVICKVDKINCSGKIFLEPIHPFYDIGKQYDFKVKRITESLDPWNNIIFTAWVFDIFEMIWPCTISASQKDLLEGADISCFIERIKKSELTLSSPELAKDIKLIPRQFYNFTIEGETTHNKADYYILRDMYNNKHLIRKDYYSHYSYEIGQKIRAQIVDRWPDLTYKIEPDNPYYEIGNVYEFNFLNIELNTDPLGDITGVFRLEDKFGNKTEVKAFSWQIFNPKYKPEIIKCKVIRFKKGKLQLENMEKPNE